MSRGRQGSRNVGRGERIRIAICFSLLGAVPVFLLGWLGYVQVLGAARLPRGDDLSPLRLGGDAADRQRDRTERLPAPRGTVLDRNGRILAVDCEAYEVRADITLFSEFLNDAGALRGYLDGLVADLASVLGRDPEVEDPARFRIEQRRRLVRRLDGAFGLRELPAEGPLPPDQPSKETANVLVATDVVSLPVIEGLRALDAGRDSVLLHWQRVQRRVYPEHEVTHGVVGFTKDYLVPVKPGSDRMEYRRYGEWGAEQLAVLAPGTPGWRPFSTDAFHRSYWLAAGKPPEQPAVLHTALDLELQKVACQELYRQAEHRTGDADDQRPQWGALVLIEVQSGDVLAMASWHRDLENQTGSRVNPYQALYEPGSVVKPLVFGFALQKADLDWHGKIDCTPHLPRHGWREPSYGRLIRDDHACGKLTPHGVLVNSSNIGAVQVGMSMSRDLWSEYLEFYQFGTTLGVELPKEQLGSHPNRRPGPPIHGLSDRGFWKYTVPALSIGYELNVTALQLARAYLTLLSGAQRQLHLYKAVEVGGKRVEVPPRPVGPRQLAPATVLAVREAMADVVAAGRPATGRHLHELLRKEAGVDVHRLIGGKTGTAVSKVHDPERGKIEVRNASFVGFAPVDQPRYLAVCVLQKDDAVRFYGGSYAAPPAGRLLLYAVRREAGERSRRDRQVSGDLLMDQAGAGRASETTTTGR